MTANRIMTALNTVRKQKPLVVNLTNYVVMNPSANALLAIGASPIMAHSRAELNEMMAMAGALVINIGTLDSHWIARMHYAIEQANHYHKPVILDPVGCGVTRLRTYTAQTFAQLAEHIIIRGNASEIIGLAGDSSHGKGVDALDSSDTAVDAGRFLVQHYQANVVISGETDHILTSTEHIMLHNGSPMMPYVTGTGCTLSALVGAFAAVGENTGLAATAIMGIAGELAAKISQGPASLQLHLIDALYHMDSDTLSKYLAIQSQGSH